MCLPLTRWKAGALTLDWQLPMTNNNKLWAMMQLCINQIQLKFLKCYRAHLRGANLHALSNVKHKNWSITIAWKDLWQMLHIFHKQLMSLTTNSIWRQRRVSETVSIDIRLERLIASVGLCWNNWMISKNGRRRKSSCGILSRIKNRG